MSLLAAMVNTSLGRSTWLFRFYFTGPLDQDVPPSCKLHLKSMGSMLEQDQRDYGSLIQWAPFRKAWDVTDRERDQVVQPLWQQCWLLWFHTDRAVLRKGHRQSKFPFWWLFQGLKNIDFNVHGLLSNSTLSLLLSQLHCIADSNFLDTTTYRKRKKVPEKQPLSVCRLWKHGLHWESDLLGYGKLKHFTATQNKSQT
jgi:hypothetical protein